MGVKNLQEKTYLGELGGWVGSGVNLLLFATKLALGLLTHSVAIIADAFHTLSDILTSLIILVSFRISRKPGDREHPFGHGRVDYIATIIVATLLAVTGFEIARSGFERLLHPVPLNPSWLIIGIVAATILVKEGLAQFSETLARKIESQSLAADAWHHRSDALSSILVVVALILSRYGIYSVDGVAGMAIGVFIVLIAFRVSRNSVNQLLGTPAEESLVREIENIVLNSPEVLGVHDIVIHNYGDVKVVSYHIEVDEKLSLMEAHQLSEKVDRDVRGKLGVYTTVHVDPVMQRTEAYLQVEKILREYTQKDPAILSFHDLRIISEEGHPRLFVDFVLQPETQVKDERELIRRIRDELFGRLPQFAEMNITVEPHFSISRRSRHN